MADPKDKKIAALGAKIEELQSILPPVNEIKAQLEERKAACRALKTQLDRSKEENKRLSRKVGELEGKQGVSAGGGSATVKGLRLQVLKLEKEKKMLLHELSLADGARGAAAATAEDEMRRLKSIIEDQKKENQRLQQDVEDLKEQQAVTLTSAQEAIDQAREEAEMAAAAAAAGAVGAVGAARMGATDDDGDNPWPPPIDNAFEDDDSPALPPGTPRDRDAGGAHRSTRRRGEARRGGGRRLGCPLPRARRRRPRRADGAV